MSRFRSWPIRRRRGSSRTARAARSPNALPTGWTSYRLHPDSDSHLSDGVVVETHLLARVLGMRLLRVDGVVLLSPGRLQTSSARPPATAVASVGYDLTEAAKLLKETESTLRAVVDREGPARAG